ncbi:thioredoxin-2-like [Chelonus insularis]|uniref:thioredoxin-2-like n=1 Tax=Chelonus insularis TaxID=460826 RepID=UPI00158BC34A|nr:thioredoxin-2-like [Chelonus insularis]
MYKIKDMNDLNEKLQTNGNKLVVIDFMAPWCAPCTRIGPKLEEMAIAMKDFLVVYKVNVDECEDIATEYNINSMPTFVFIKNNKKLDELNGDNVEKLRNTILKLK